MRIRKATQQDLHSIMQLYENARAFMREHGNPGQWGTTYPPQNMIETDIRFGNLYVCIEKDTIEAVFFYKDGIDPMTSPTFALVNEYRATLNTTQ